MIGKDSIGVSAKNVEYNSQPAQVATEKKVGGGFVGIVTAKITYK